MKTVVKLGLYGISVGVAVIIAGCTTPVVEADYVLPARKVADVSKVDVVKLKVTANITGNMAGDKAMNEALIRQMLASRLYKGGYYQVMDDFWGPSDGGEKIQDVLSNATAAGHMYSTYFIGETIPDRERCPKCGKPCSSCELDHKGVKAKAELEIAVNLDLNTNETIEEQTFELVTMPYQPVQVKSGMPPTSAPNVVAAQKSVQNVATKVFKTVAEGTVTAKFNGINGGESPVDYSNSFQLPIVKVEEKPASSESNSLMGGFKAAAAAAFSKKEEKDFTNLGSPSQLEALAEALSPAIAEIVSDISPYKETRKLVVNEDGDKRVVTLLKAQAFREAVAFVSELARSGNAVGADYENLGIAQEAMGKFDLARKAFKKAVKFNPEKPSKTAQAGLDRVVKILEGEKAIAKSGAKKDASTQFKNAN